MPRALRADVDQAGERDQQFHLADDRRGGGRFRCAGFEPALRFDRRKERDPRRELRPEHAGRGG